MYNLASAAAATGANRSTILRAIKAGRLSAQRDAQGGWEVDPAELHRVFPPLPAAAAAAQETAQRDALADALVTELRGVIADLRQDREDLRQDRDHWREAFQQQHRLLPSAPQPGAQATPGDSGLARVWRWMRKAG
jgi:hypothetical protein